MDENSLLALNLGVPYYTEAKANIPSGGQKHK